MGLFDSILGGIGDAVDAVTGTSIGSDITGTLGVGGSSGSGLSTGENALLGQAGITSTGGSSGSSSNPLTFASLLQAGGTLASGLLSSGASKSAASTTAAAQLQASQEALALQQQEFQTQQGNLQPFLKTSAAALGELGQGTSAGGQFETSFTPADLQANLDPGYQFQLQQGQQAVDRSAAARGTLLSGGTLKALTQYGQNFANTAYQNAYSRFMTTRQNNFSNLSNLAGLGTQTNATGAGLAASAIPAQASTLAQGITGAAGAQSSGITGSANALSGMLASLGNTGFTAAAGGAI